MAEQWNDEELLDLGERSLQIRFAMDSVHMSAVFNEISIPNYLILSNLSRRTRLNEPDAKVYLSDISREMELSITGVSRMVQNLQSMGYVYWEHDRQGTYIYLSEIGREVMQRQQEILRTFFGNVVSRIGRDAYIESIEQMEQLKQVMETEAEKLAGTMAEDPEGKPEDK